MSKKQIQENNISKQDSLDSTELVSWSIKVRPEQKETLRLIKDSYGTGEDVGDFLINLIALDNAKRKFAGRKVEIDAFKSHLSALQDAFIASLDTCNSIQQRFEKEILKAKDTSSATIKIREEKIEELSTQLVLAQETLAITQDMASSAQKGLEQANEHLQIAESALKDKSLIIQSLEKELKDAKGKAKDYPELLKSYNNLVIEDANKANLISKLNECLERKEQEFASEKEQLTTKLQYQSDQVVNKMESEKTVLINKYEKELLLQKSEAENSLLKMQSEKEAIIAQLSLDKQIEITNLKDEINLLSLEKQKFLSELETARRKS